MRITRNLEFQAGSKEERLPFVSSDFPYLASRAELDYYRESFVPWHWHNAIELFYMESGELDYHTPNGTVSFSAGTAGMINSNVLHMTKIRTHSAENVQLLHLFDPNLLAGYQGSAIGRKYIMPIVASSRIEVVAFRPEEPGQAAVIELIRGAFSLSEDDLGYEIRIREELSRIWLRIFERCAPILRDRPQSADRTTDKLKAMMVYIHEHYAEKITVSQLAGSAFLSERECYRVFRNHLHMTPVEYMQSYRIQAARQMLADSRMPITEIGYACGLGNASYFGKIFRAFTGETPLQYRRKWQDRCKK
ncbi:MAG TPA: AraC family transcriptional regulator [Candidatus Eisenbergiella merdigallinarum]|uniref:AraC family transcriptional regulator n=1 Tax=Candidatus Eisenbergiella merdigallinarum TaxID=2838552 RepID=A0A9D2MU00_9FIRM|nr:AraC family transcriptional regulator [Candidatus Eisenbergiella merdigallinarum]